MDRWEHEVVVGVALGSQTVGVVRRSDGTLLFPGRVDVRGGVVLTDFTPHGRTIDGRLVVVGRRLSGVERVVVIDDRGEEHQAVLADEAWVAVASDAGFAEPLARFEDAGGDLVALPLPDGRRSAVEDADAPCPVCSAVQWIEVDDRVHCERCGFQVGAGMMFMRFDAVDDAPDSEWVDDDDDDDWETEERREQEAVLRAARFPVYAVSGREYQVGGYGGDPEEGVTSISLIHGDGARFVQVDSQVRERWLEDDRLRERLSGLDEPRAWPDGLSDAALRVHLAHADRVARRRAAQAERTTREFVIDGEAETFAFIALGDAWVARRDHYGITVELTDTEPTPARSNSPGSRARHRRPRKPAAHRRASS